MDFFFFPQKEKKLSPVFIFPWRKEKELPPVPPVKFNSFSYFPPMGNKKKAGGKSGVSKVKGHLGPDRKGNWVSPFTAPPQLKQIARVLLILPKIGGTRN